MTSSVHFAVSRTPQLRSQATGLYYLGLKVIQDKRSGGVWIGQPVYAENVMQNIGMENAKSMGTPVDSSVKLVKGTEESKSVD